MGPARSLVGVLTRPRDVRAPSPAVVIVNNGIVHRVGNHRMFVTLARELAQAGHIVLRFDLSGLGDSRRREDALSADDAALADTSEAIDALSAKCGSTEFVILGLCSGSDVALRYGHTDERVVGLVLLDPEMPPTLRFYANYIRERMLRLRSWITFVRGRGRIWSDAAIAVCSLLPGGRRVAFEVGSAADIERNFRSSIDRGIELFVALTGGDLAWRQTYREQLLDAFPTVPFNGKLRLEYFSHADHTFSRAEDRARLNKLIVDWLSATRFAQVSSK